ncbi:hypothetical protein F5148DRAFT_835197 [Russula earlei]|uniref:Uncharacterized protein n=1 Tax=Russula earlei TaxID=71964 RepID=A0ACC0UB10_9AGAM|nr:hypothetical protein F5148DRAFT_835197 [Russula earlei]
MATVAHYIRSEYVPDIDRDRLSREAAHGQTPEDPVDPWQTEPSSAGFFDSRRLANAPPPTFVPAHLPCDEWGTPARAQPAAARATASDPRHGDVATWYRSLGRQGAAADVRQRPLPPPPASSITRCHPSLEAAPGPPSSLPPPVAAPAPAPAPAPASSPSPANAIANANDTGAGAGALSSSARRVPHEGDRDWFISRAISQALSASAPPTPRPSAGGGGGGSLAEMLARHPPSARPFRPPVFLHLGPSNKGWAMLQNQGWSEGEGLGAASASRVGGGGGDARAGTSRLTKEERKAKGTRSDSPSHEGTTEEAEMEHVLLVDDDDDDDDDPVIEVRRKTPAPVIDLTQCDIEEEEGDEDDAEHDRPSSLSPSPPLSPSPSLAPIPFPASAADPIIDRTTSDPRAAQTALLTPLPAILKSDRLGIGLKARTESSGSGGAYRTTIKRVTHSDAALAAHLKAAEHMRRTQQAAR